MSRLVPLSPRGSAIATPIKIAAGLVGIKMSSSPGPMGIPVTIALPPVREEMVYPVIIIGDPVSRIIPVEMRIA